MSVTQPSSHAQQQQQQQHYSKTQYHSSNSSTLPHQNQKVYAKSQQSQMANKTNNSDPYNSSQNQYETVQNHKYAPTIPPTQPRVNDVKVPKSKMSNEQIYTRAADRNLHYQQQQQQQLHQNHQPTQHYAASPAQCNSKRATNEYASHQQSSNASNDGNKSYLLMR